MSLTLKTEQRLSSIGLIQIFAENEGHWRKFAQEAYDYVRKNFPKNSMIRKDDLSDPLVAVLAVDTMLGNFLKEKRKREKYWVRFFADLILDRCWDAVAEDAEGG